MVEQELQEVGLTANETKIYICLLDNADLSAGKITSKTGIHRRNVYDALNRLLAKGLVNETITDNKKQFNAVHPKHLLDLMNAQKANVESILPKLSNKFNFVEKRHIVRTYKGLEGVKASYSDAVRQGKINSELIIIGGIHMKNFMGSFIDEIYKERIRKNITTVALFNHQFQNRINTLPKDAKHKIKVLPKGFYLPVQTVIVGKDIVYHILIHDEPFVIQVIDEEFANNYKKYFQMLWNMSRDP